MMASIIWIFWPVHLCVKPWILLLSAVRPAGLLLCVVLGVQHQLLPGSCNFELGTCGYTSDPEYGSWSMNEEGKVSSRALLIDGNKRGRNAQTNRL